MELIGCNYGNTQPSHRCFVILEFSSLQEETTLPAYKKHCTVVSHGMSESIWGKLHQTSLQKNPYLRSITSKI